MEKETIKILNKEIRKLIISEKAIDFDKAIKLIKAINNPFSCN